MYAIEMIFNDYGLEFTEEDQSIIDSQIESDITSAGGEEIFVESLAMSGMTPALYEELIKSTIYQDKLVEELKKEVSQDEINAYVEENYVRVLHVLVESSDKSQIDQDLANTVLQRAQAGDDFMSLVDEYGEDPGMEGNTDGYYFTYGEMVAEFEEASFALEIDEVSGIVETSYGYHIIKRYDFDEEYIANNVDTLAMMLYLDKLNDKITEKIETVEFTPNEFYDMITPETL